MTAFHAIGKYEIGATDEQKIAALTECISAAAIELIDLGSSPVEVENALDAAMEAAQDEWDTNIAAKAEKEGETSADEEPFGEW